MRRTLWLIAAVLLASHGLAEDRPHLLVTNDDGILAPGIVALVAALQEEYRITVCAPFGEQSGVGHGITYREPVLVEEMDQPGPGVNFAVHAQPATTVRIGAGTLLLEDPPDLVVSGINHGDNSGRSVWISGTLAGAREAALAGFPAVAFSAARPPEGGDPDFAAGAAWALEVLRVLRKAGLPSPGTVVKVELPYPAAVARGIRVTAQGLAVPAVEHYEEQVDPDGRRWFVSRWAPPAAGEPGTDIAGVLAGYVTVTPLSLDQTDYRAIPELAALPWPTPPPLPEPVPPITAP